MIELRQKACEKRLGFSASYELLTDGLRTAKTPVHCNGKGAPLDTFLLQRSGLFQKGKTDGLKVQIEKALKAIERMAPVRGKWPSWTSCSRPTSRPLPSS